MFKTNTTNGRFNIGWRVSGRLWWEINFGMNILDFMWVIVQSRVTLVDSHPIKVQMTVPDYVDQFSTAIGAYTETCMGLEFDTSVLNVATNFNINFKRMNLSLLDVFNKDTDNKTQDIDSSGQQGGDDVNTAEEDEAEEEEAPEEEEAKILLMQAEEEEEEGEEEEEVEEEAAAEEEEEEDSEGPSQEDFAVEAKEIEITWTYQATGEAAISNAAQYAGWSWTLPIYQWCWFDATYRNAFKAVFEGFLEGKWGEKIKKSYP